ncbi:COG3014 family protein [Paraglaciecola arctica]|uniref:Uncharacterized protein n=1 Tax=Paraglaciecola arctica BSs20135 TaxID=493475 RepID=K6ZDK6_9ALTE|nr:hypothetical protein [Paraglaciecola arctica]GAC21500.1 hypothetical protein GARC_4558 [Paraglaciecola arctica BSs20135]
MHLFVFTLLSPNRLLKRLILLSLILSFSACTSMGFKDLFSDYAEQLRNARNAQLKGDFKAAATMIVEPKTNQNNYTLNLLEKARLHYLANDWAQSRKDFALVSNVLDEEATKAKLRLSGGASNMAALVSSDNAIAYHVPAYEQTMLHSYQALNYLFLGQLEGALVEVRRANLVQENALKQNQQDLAKEQANFDKKSLNQAYPSMSAMIGDIKNGFQNAYTFYLSGLLYEAALQPNDAYIDYKRALEIYPNNHYLQQDVLRLATKLNMTDDLALFSAKYGAYQSNKITDAGELVILIENGAINPKQEVALNLPIFSGYNQPRLFSFALPVYQGTLTRYTPLKITVAGQTYTSEQIVRLQSLASKQLQEQMPGLVTRQALRLVAKEKLRSTMSKEGGDIGNILAVIYNAASEQADTRSWLTLPDEVQILRLSLPAGKQLIDINFGDKTELIEVDIQAKRISLLNMTTIGNFQGHKLTQL